MLCSATVDAVVFIHSVLILSVCRLHIKHVFSCTFQLEIHTSEVESVIMSEAVRIHRTRVGMMWYCM